MREITIILSLLAYPGVTHAAGFKDIITFAGGDASRLLSVVLTIFALGVIGFVGSAILGMIDKQKFGRLFERCCYIFAFVLFAKEAIGAVNYFITFLMG